MKFIFKSGAYVLTDSNNVLEETENGIITTDYELRFSKIKIKEIDKEDIGVPKICQWRLIKEGNPIFETICGHKHTLFPQIRLNDSEMEYCPYCGGMIEETYKDND